MAGEARIVRVYDQLAEQAAERDMLLDREFLIAKEDDLMRRQRLADGPEELGTHGLAQIDAEDLGTARRRQRMHRHPIGVVGPGVAGMAIETGSYPLG
jgi:hypothetical protein